MSLLQCCVCSEDHQGENQISQNRKMRACYLVMKFFTKSLIFFCDVFSDKSDFGSIGWKNSDDSFSAGSLNTFVSNISIIVGPMKAKFIFLKLWGLISRILFVSRGQLFAHPPLYGYFKLEINYVRKYALRRKSCAGWPLLLFFKSQYK